METLIRTVQTVLEMGKNNSSNENFFFEACIIHDIENSSEMRLFCKVKLIRAQGECLGIRSRRRTRQAAISSGERHIRIDPEISEWGNPAEQYSVNVH